ncbi:unnamed protein product [Malus baccata var. baccata]
MSHSEITILIIVFLTFLWSLLRILINASSRQSQKLPPGPMALPIIGNLHMLGNLPHRNLQNLAKKYGPIMSMRLGNKTTIVVSSPKAAEQFLKTHNTIFASRPQVQASKYMSYDTKAMAFSEYGPYWRHVRKLCTLQLLSPSRIEAFAPLRREEVGLLVQSLKVATEAGEVVDLSEKVGELVVGITYRMVLGRKNNDMFDLKGIIEEVMFLSGAFNIGDYVPFLIPLDLQGCYPSSLITKNGLTKRMKRISKTVDQLFEKIIQDHEQVSRSEQVQGNHHKDFVDVLLSLIHQPLNPNDEEVYMFERTNAKAILLDMISGSLDTSATAIVWTLAELLRHPKVMKHLQKELQSVVGMDRMVEESDLPKLDYLSMVVKESFRLHPVGPLLVPHQSMEDVITIGRDPNVWSDNVKEFYPERFMNSNVDLQGHDFQLIPFGSGRRGCPAMQLGLTTVRLALGNLTLDMTEKFGLSLSKAEHLLAMPTHRL